VALSLAGTAFVGSVVLLVGYSAEPVGASVAQISGDTSVVSDPDLGETAIAQRGDQLFRPARALKADRLPITALTNRQLMQDPETTGSVMAYLPNPSLTHAAFNAMPADGGLQPAELEPEALDDDHDADVASPMAAAKPPVKPVLGYNIPVPSAKPDKPRVEQAYPTAAKASLVGIIQADANRNGASDKSRFSLFSALPPARPADQSKQRVASLAPLTDIPPARGLSVPTPFGIPYVLQTESVDDSCLKPELISILRKIEGHYGQKITLTSGARAKGREGSLHKTCQAADIIVPGVDAESLAAWVRKGIPEVGGVGTYCHPQMIHVDVGTPRDWKYGCGHSYFAMRDGSAGWGDKRMARAQME
jgi:hypothetical protein